jgi:precorrin-2 dehydrogenase / sirohydrochlorin ferrochelatase
MIDLHPSAGSALVVGGGQVAARKVRGLVEAGFAVRVISPVVGEGIREAAGVTVEERRWAAADLGSGEGVALVYACTDLRDVNREVGEAARRLGIPVVVADSQDESTFFSPAILRDGELQVAVSTRGASPGLAQAVRERIASALGTGWAATVETARETRQARLRDRQGDER